MARSVGATTTSAVALGAVAIVVSVAVTTSGESLYVVFIRATVVTMDFIRNFVIRV